MKMNKKSIALSSSTLGVALLLAACSPNVEEEVANPSGLESLSSIQVLDAMPTGALSVQAAREQLKPGDKASVMGQIGGVDDPFLSGYAGFILGDTGIEFCDEMGDDHCSTPWDACCEDPDKLKQLRASVQFLGADGQPLNSSLEGFSGLKGLSRVVVTGIVAESSTPDNLIINASALYVGK